MHSEDKVQSLLGAFANIEKTPISFFMFVYPLETTWFPQDSFLWQFMFGSFTEICGHNSVLFKVGEEKRTIYVKAEMHFLRVLRCLHSSGESALEMLWEWSHGHLNFFYFGVIHDVNKRWRHNLTAHCLISTLKWRIFRFKFISSFIYFTSTVLIKWTIFFLF